MLSLRRAGQTRASAADQDNLPQGWTLQDEAGGPIGALPMRPDTAAPASRAGCRLNGTLTFTP